MLVARTHDTPVRTWGGTESTITEATAGLLYQPRMVMGDDECGAVGGMIGSGNRSTRRIPATVLLCPLQFPHDLIWARNWTAAVGSRQLTP
jgi:hypothetical protein